MKLFFCTIFSGVGLITAHTFNFTEERISQLSNVLEYELPGSVDWLHEWAIDESISEELEAVVDGRNRPSPEMKKGSVAMFLFSLNPDIPLFIFMGILDRIYGSANSTTEEILRYYLRMSASRSIPDWLYRHLREAKAVQLPRDQVHVTVSKLVAFMQRIGRIDPRDSRFNSGSDAIRSLTALWLRVGFTTNTLSPQPVEFNPTSQEWVLTRSTSQETFRHLAIMSQRR